jgi:hypothetical protein
MGQRGYWIECMNFYRKQESYYVGIGYRVGEYWRVQQTIEINK